MVTFSLYLNSSYYLHTVELVLRHCYTSPAGAGRCRSAPDGATAPTEEEIMDFDCVPLARPSKCQAEMGIKIQKYLSINYTISSLHDVFYCLLSAVKHCIYFVFVTQIVLYRKLQKKVLLRCDFYSVRVSQNRRRHCCHRTGRRRKGSSPSDHQSVHNGKVDAIAPPMILAGSIKRDYGTSQKIYSDF
uniref:Uncharacterized protein n=1 Tax=Romanomermis culicivorax TaxID=13658 RepID=A0A915IEN0_ROMCU